MSLMSHSIYEMKDLISDSLALSKACEMVCSAIGVSFSRALLSDTRFTISSTSHSRRILPKDEDQREWNDRDQSEGEVPAVDKLVHGKQHIVEVLEHGPLLHLVPIHDNIIQQILHERKGALGERLDLPHEE